MFFRKSPLFSSPPPLFITIIHDSVGGPNLLVDLSIVVSDRKSLSSAHWSAEKVSLAISRAFDNVSDVVVRMEPFTKDVFIISSERRTKRLLRHRAEREIREDVTRAASATKGVDGVSPVGVHYRDSGIFVDVNILCSQRAKSW